VVIAALSQVKSPYPHSAVSPNQITQSLIAVLAGLGGTAVSPWVDGSASFAQANLETGDAIEAMNAVDVVYNVTLNTTGGAYNYTLQNVPTLEWFIRTPFNGGIYSWPNEHTLNQATHGVNCNTPFVCSWLYGQGSAGFFFGPPF
jgi:hypothetical protein